MAEMSKEESKSVIKKWLGCNDCDTDECLSSICVDCKNHYDEDDFRQALEKSISDMEKMEKIEKIFEDWQEAYCEDCTLCGGCCRLEEILDLKEQILRGVE